MSLAQSTEQAVAAAKSRSVFDKRPVIFGSLGLIAFYALTRAYQQAYGWSAGLDSYAPEYQSYWGSILTAATPVAILAAIGLPALLWRSRDRNLEALDARTEMRRYLTLVQLLTLYAFALYWGLSFFTEQTAVWHMTAVRDSDFTPANIITFHVAYPVFCVTGLVAFYYARTRLPFYANGYSLALLIFVAGVFMTIPNVGFNEWGHSFWSMEEGFASPVHWGFVFFGWMALAVFGVTLQLLARVRALIGAEGVALLT